MYWRRGKWEDLEEGKARIKVEELGKELAKAKGREETLLVYCSDTRTETDVFECRLVTHVAYRALRFYSKNKSKNTPAKTDIDKEDIDKAWCVYRFTCRIHTDKSDELARYLPEAAFFAVCGPRDTSTPRWILLDWTSALCVGSTRLHG